MLVFGQQLEGSEMTQRSISSHKNIERELRTIFCRCVADFETFYDDDRRQLKSYFQYDGELPTASTKEERQSLRAKTSRYYRGEDYLSSSPRQSSSTTNVVLGPDGYFVVDGITVLPLDNDACIVSQTNAALRTFLQLVFRPRQQDGTRSSSLRSFSSLFQKRNRRTLLSDKTKQHEDVSEENDPEGNSDLRDLQGWDERRKKRPKSGNNSRGKTVKSILDTDLREYVPNVPEGPKPRPQPSPSGFPRVFPCPELLADVAPSFAPSFGIETSSPTSSPQLIATDEPSISVVPTVMSRAPAISVAPAVVSVAPTISVSPTVTPRPATESPTASLEPTVSPVPTVAPTAQLKVTAMPSGAPTFNLAPSFTPSISPEPTISHMPTNVETLEPTVSHEPSVSMMPSIDPTTSFSPTSVTQSPNNSVSPSIRPSAFRSLAPAISLFPTTSTAPTISPAPNGGLSVGPSFSPSIGIVIEPTFSQQPSVSELPSFVPSFSNAPSANPSSAPSSGPTRTAVPVTQPVLNIVDRLARFRPKNNVCDEALALAMDGSPLSGTTNMGTNEEDYGCGVSGGIQTSISPGVWFTAVGNGNIYEVSTCSERTNFGTAIQVLTGGCGSLECLQDAGRVFDRSCSKSNSNEWNRFGTRVRIESVADEEYSFLVLSRLVANSGDFDIRLEEITPPLNDRCDQAINFEVDVSKVHIGTTVNATIGNNYGCGLSSGGVNNLASGIWYATVGNGAIYTASTCANWTNFNTAIQVFGGGSCDQLTCLAGSISDDECNSSGASRVSFPTVVGELYYVYVFGRLERDAGTFILTLTSDSDSPKL
jgi:hypothetical protein